MRSRAWFPVSANDNRHRIARQHCFEIDAGCFGIQVAEYIGAIAQGQYLVDDVSRPQSEERPFRNLVED